MSKRRPYDDNLYLLTLLRARVAVLTNTGIALGCIIWAFSLHMDVTRKVLLSSAIGASVSGLLALKTQQEHQKAQEDVVDLSDQVRTNDIYSRLQYGDSSDFSAQLYNYIVMELGRGRGKTELVRTLAKDENEANRLWEELEGLYGRFPTGGV